MQIQTKIPAFKDFSYLLSQSDSIANPAEIHGILCGLICSGQKLDGKFWFHTVLKLFEAKAHIAPHNRGMVIELYDATCRQLSRLDSDFELLLPDDNQALAIQAEALSQWCQGYLYGLRLADNTILDKSTEDSRDALRCISEIAKLDFSSIEVREIDSKAYHGVVEFVRSSVIVLYDELSGLPHNKTATTSLH